MLERSSSARGCAYGCLLGLALWALLALAALVILAGLRGWWG